MQGRFKRDDGAAGDPEARGGSGRGPEPRSQTDEALSAAPASPRSGLSTGEGGGARGTRATGPSGGGTQDVKPPVTSGSQGKHASRLAMRNWSIRTRLVSLLALPVVAATTLGGLRIQSSLDNVNQLDHMKLLTEITGHATKLADALQEERDSSAGPITSGHPTDDAVIASRQTTDREEQAFEAATRHISNTDPSLVGVHSTIDDISRQLENLKQLRDNAYTHNQYISQTVSGYNQLITSLLSLTEDMAQATSNADMIRSTRALAAFTSAKEYESIQRAVISAALADPSGHPTLSTSDRQYAQAAADEEQSETERFEQVYGASGSASLLKALRGGNVVVSQADQYRERVLKSAGAIGQQPKSYLDWYDEDDTKLQAMSKIEAELLDQMQQQALTLRSSAQQDALINGALILLVLGVSLIGAFVVARSMIRSLRRLQNTAQEVSQKRLPDLVKQLSESDPQDLDTSVAEIGITTRDEIGRVARAFDDVHREAVRLAAEQALLRGNVNAMFTNLSRRSQGLIQRQLSLISELESREADPDQLSNLFKLDHLATRMRRNGENLLVLAGEEPGRRWTRPVPLVDVLRAAASEVEQYERIELTSVPPTEVAGRVVNDLVHLLAELLENATSFSSPQTKVRVTGHALPDGRVLVEIHDTGIGLSPEDLADINERLANPPTVDVSVSRRMGLFVVGRLSLRHGIRIQLRPSDSGGTTALVMLPVELTQGGAKNGAGTAPPQQQGKRAAPAPGAGPTGSGVGQPIGRAASLGPAASQSRGQVPAAEPRPALTGSRDSADGGPERAQTRASGLPVRGRQTPQTPAPAAQDERPAPSWAQRDEQTGAHEVPRGHDDVRGVESTQPFERPDFHRGAPSGGDQFFTSQREQAGQQRPQEPEFTGQQGYADSRQDGLQAPAEDFFAPRQSSRPQRPEAPQSPQQQSGAQAPPTRRAPQETRGGIPQGLRQGQQMFRGAPQDGAGYPQDATTGEFRAPLHAGSGSDVFGPRGRQATPAQPGQGQPEPARADVPERAPQGLGGQDFAPRGGNPVPPGGRGGYDEAASTGQFPVAGGQNGGREPERARQGGFGGELPPAGEPMALPPASSPGDGRSPIFESLESDWFRRQAAARGEVAEYGQDELTAPLPVPEQARAGQEPDGGPGSGGGLGGVFSGGPRSSVPLRPQSRPQQPSGGPQRPPSPQAPQPGSQRLFGGGFGGGDGSEGRPQSANDERWRRAEQVREPAAGGITPSGLPKRVPRANLVPGTAQQTPQTGPQVSRAPDDVRGRLTNLRRGIQQGRNAGAGRSDGREPGDYRSGTTHQQER